jgi:hypothetical protein
MWEEPDASFESYVSEVVRHRCATDAGMASADEPGVVSVERLA